MKNPHHHLLPDRPDQPVILIVDDDVLILNVARVTMERDGYFVLTAEDGDNALHLSRNYPGDIHLLLTDVRMPRMSGIQLGKRVQRERPETRVLLMSGAFDENNPGFTLLHKPFGITKLSETVKGLLPPIQKREQGA
jgi:DNA-binding NtrC family response regulator